METKEVIKGVLAAWGFPILDEQDNHLVFRFQMSYVHVSVLNSEDPAIAVTLSGLFKVENPKEERVCLRTCNYIGMQLMQVKAYVDSDNDLIIASEFFCKSEQDMEFLLLKALESVVTGKKAFGRKYRELDEEDTMMLSLENPEEESSDEE